MHDTNTNRPLENTHTGMMSIQRRKMEPTKKNIVHLKLHKDRRRQAKTCFDQPPCNLSDRKSHIGGGEREHECVTQRNLLWCETVMKAEGNGERRRRKREKRKDRKQRRKRGEEESRAARTQGGSKCACAMKLGKVQ